MKGFVRLFPLNWVIFPGELANLHIFEPRYRQLIQECDESGEPFGIPFFHEGLKGFGTLLFIKEIRKKYPDGRMDISAEGIEPFEILKFIPKVEGKLYPGGSIRTLSTTYSFDKNEAQELQVLIEKFFDLIGMRPEGRKPAFERLSFTFGHKLGLSQEKELELLLMPDESSRQQFLIEHLENVIPTLEEVEVAKKRIQLNGHIKNFDPLDF
jgi:hypothetical protein